MMKKCIVCVLAICIALSLCACGHEHEYGEWAISKPATCTEEGLEERSCVKGDDTESRSLPATGHKFGEWVQLAAATCTETGLQEHTCSICGEKETEEIPATGHSFGEWTDTVAVTCDANGKHERKCTVCGATEEEEVESTGHDYAAATLVAPKTCKKCGATEGEALATVLSKDMTVTAEDHEFTVSNTIFTSSLSERAGNTTYNYESGHYLAIKLDFTNLSTESLERWFSNRITDCTLTYAGKYNYEGEYWVPIDDIVPLQRKNLYIVYEVPSSMDSDSTSEIIAAFSIDNIKYAMIIQEGSSDGGSSTGTELEANVESTVNINDVRTNGDTFSFKLIEVKATSSLKEQSGYTTYHYSDGHYLAIKLEFTNMSTETLEEWGTNRIVACNLKYANKYDYEGELWIPIDEIVPLQTKNMYIVYEIPDSIDSDSEALVATFTIDGCEFTVDCRANM